MILTVSDLSKPSPVLYVDLHITSINISLNISLSINIYASAEFGLNNEGFLSQLCS